jgi:hypothetical protein
MKDESELKRMSKKEKFIECIDSLFADLDMADIDPDVIAYWKAFKGKGTSDKPLFTDNGKMILKYMQEHVSDMPMGKAKDIAEGMFVSSRTVSGAIQKLVKDGYVEKIGSDPVVYALTDNGKTVNIND